jgi:hypothetical protein
LNVIGRRVCPNSGSVSSSTAKIIEKIAVLIFIPIPHRSIASHEFLTLSDQQSVSRRSEPALAAICLVEYFTPLIIGRGCLLDDQLCNPVAGVQRHTLGPKVDQQHVDLTTIIGIDYPGEGVDSVPDGKTGTRCYPAVKSNRNLDRNSGWHEHSLSGTNEEIVETMKVGARCQRSGPLGQSGAFP